MREVPFVHRADDLALATNISPNPPWLRASRRSRQVLHFEPIRRSAGTVWQSRCLLTMTSRPSLQTCLTPVGPFSSMWSLNQTVRGRVCQSQLFPGPDLAPFKVHLLTRAGRVMRSRNEPVQASCAPPSSHSLVAREEFLTH